MKTSKGVTSLVGLVIGFASLASADTISFGFGGTGTAFGTAIVGSTPTIEARWASGQNIDQSILFGPASGLVKLLNLKLIGATLNNATGVALFNYSTTSNVIDFSSTDPFSATAGFTDPTSVQMTFNATAGRCAAGTSCVGNFTIGGDVIYSLINSTLASALNIPAIPPALNALGTLTVTFKGTLFAGPVAGQAGNWSAGGTSPVFSGGSTFDNTNNPPTVPEPTTFALIGGSLAGLALLRRRRS